MSKMTKPPGGLDEHTPAWHLEKFIEFTKYKQMVNEPSPHLRIVGYMTKDYAIQDKLWMLGCYAATYCLPSGQVIFEHWSHEDIISKPKLLLKWLEKNWKGIITRTERRCVRSPKNMAECLISCANWIEHDFQKLHFLPADNPREYYDKTYESVTGIRFFGRYISIRFIEGLKRFCDVPAALYDVRSVGGWSPKRCMMYLHPEHIEMLRLDNAEGNRLMDSLTEELLVTVQKELPTVDSYVLAAMLCEYKGMFENRHQYVGWTIDQEPLLFDKTIAYWGGDMNKNLLWEAREALFPWQVLGEYKNRWNGTRWDITNVLRDYGYIWNDLDMIYTKTRDRNCFDNPVRRLFNA